MPYKGEVRLFAGNFAPHGWAICNGGNTGRGGGDASAPNIPDLRGRVAIHADPAFPAGQAGGSETVVLDTSHLPPHRHAAMCAGDGNAAGPDAAMWAVIATENAAPYTSDTTNRGTMSASCISPVGGGMPHDNMMPFQALNYITPLLYDGQDDDDPYLGEVRAFAGGDQLPPGWLPCDGALQQISHNQALYNLLGTTYGGDGETTFGIPDLAGSAVVGAGDGQDLTPRLLGSSGGTPFAELDISQMPTHMHTPVCATGQGNSTTPVQTLWAEDPNGNMLYGVDNNAVLSDGALMASGQGEAHENQQPFIAMRYMLAVSGIYPPGAAEGVSP